MKNLVPYVATQWTKMGYVLLNQKGRIGYVIAWLLGVPASVLLIIFLIRGH